MLLFVTNRVKAQESAVRFKDALDASITLPSSMEQSLPDRLQKFEGAFDSAEYGIGGRNFILFLWLQVGIPVLIFAWIVIAIIGFYKLMAWNTEEDNTKGKNYLIRWIVGTLIITAAAYLTNLLLGTTWSWWIIWSLWQSTGATISGVKIAQSLYDQLVFPAIKGFIFISMGILFMLVLINSYKYLFSDNQDIQTKSLSMILYNAVWIGVILLAKTIVEIVYGKYSDVINQTNETNNLWRIGTWVLETTDLWVFYVILNWIMGLATLIIIIILIYQWYLLLVNPNNAENLSKIKNNFIYIFIGLLVLWAAYLIVNVFIIN
jgi:hypothetical protein